MQNGRDNHNEKVVFLSQEEYNRLTTLEEVNRDQYIEITYLKQELAELRRMIFASKSERFIPTDSGQLSLGLDVEQKEVEKQETEEITYKRHKPKKKAPVRLPLPSHLYREKIIIEPEEDVFRGKKIGEEITEILEFTRGRFYVKQYVRSRYVLPEEDKIVIGDLPSLPIPKGNAGPGLLAHLLISKFMDHLPFYRQVQMFKREDITIAESTISGWFAATCRLLEPLYEHLKEKVRQSEYLMADETPIPVLTKDKPGSTHKGFHWVYYSPPDKLVCFDYRKGRGRDGPREFLDGFQGTLQSDGYNAYNEFENKKGITLLACLAHARRKFDKARINDPDRADRMLCMIQDLYKIESRARDAGLSHEERKELRKKESIPILGEMETWLKGQLTEVLPRSSMGEAIQYTLKLWKRLIRYTEDGRWEIDNNLIENSIRPVALGYA